jgi:hypothetical protein
MATANKRRASGKDFDDVPTSGYGEKSRKPTEQVQMLNTPDGKWTLFRPIGPAYSYAGHWITVTKKDGKLSQFYMACAAWDPESVQRQGGNGAEHCKFCALEAFYKENDTPRDDRKSRFTVDHYANVISRVEQKRKPEDAFISEAEAETGFKVLDSDSWTPVRVVRMTDNVVRKVKGIRELNVHEDENGDTQTYPASHKKYGCDIQLKYTAKNPPATRYETNRGNPTPLKKSEAGYLVWDLSDLTDYPTTAEMAAEFDSWAARNHVVVPGLTKKVAGKGKPAPVDDEDEDDGEEEVPKAKAKRKPAPVADEFEDDGEDEAPAPKAKPKKKPAPVDDDEEFSDDEDDAPPPKAKKPEPKRQAEPEDDFEDDDTPPPKAKKPAAKKPAPVDDDDDEFEDDTPAPPKGKKPAAKKPAVVEDDDEFEEEDTPPPKAKAKPGKKPPVVEDDDDFEDDEPTPPKAKKPAAAPAKKKPAPVEDDEEFEEDDEPPARKPAAKAKPAAAPAKKKRPPVEDDDDDDIPF